MFPPRHLCALFVVAMMVIAASGCRVDAIYVSNDEMHFERSEAPRYLTVANDNPEFSELDISIASNRDWILVEPKLVRSRAPQGGVRDAHDILVQIDRTRLRTVGTHEGRIRLSAQGVKPVDVKVSAQQTTAPPTGGLAIVNPTVVYSTPYLIEFAFALRDQQNRAVAGTPGQFAITAREDAVEVGSAQGVSLRRGSSRQLWLELVLDYSIVMQEVEGAISGMEHAAAEILLPSLNADTFVAVSEYHRDDQTSNLVMDFTMDKEETAARIRQIQAEYVRGFASGARMYDALLASVRRFGLVSAGAEDDNYIVLFSNGRDTSSTAIASQVAAEAVARGVKIIAVGFGEAVDSGALVTLASLTGGRYIPAQKVEDLQAAFQRIVEDLEGQYVLRWASLRRDNKAVTPAFDIAFGGASASYSASRTFRATDYAADALSGKLTLVQSDTPSRTTVFLRANYVPRGIGIVQCWVKSDYNFSTSLVGPADDGLMADWTLLEPWEEEGGYWLAAVSNGANLPFAAFGPMLRFDFNQAVETPFTQFHLDNSVYAEGQTLGFE